MFKNDGRVNSPLNKSAMSTYSFLAIVTACLRRMLDGRKNAIGLLVCYRNFAAYLRLCPKYVTGTTVVVLSHL
jgi:hypothetical protein